MVFNNGQLGTPRFHRWSSCRYRILSSVDAAGRIPRAHAGRPDNQMAQQCVSFSLSRSPTSLRLPRGEPAHHWDVTTRSIAIIKQQLQPTPRKVTGQHLEPFHGPWKTSGTQKDNRQLHLQLTKFPVHCHNLISLYICNNTHKKFSYITIYIHTREISMNIKWLA